MEFEYCFQNILVTGGTCVCVFVFMLFFCVQVWIVESFLKYNIATGIYADYSYKCITQFINNSSIFKKLNQNLKKGFLFVFSWLSKFKTKKNVVSTTPFLINIMCMVWIYRGRAYITCVHCTLWIYISNMHPIIIRPMDGSCDRVSTNMFHFSKQMSTRPEEDRTN